MQQITYIHIHTHTTSTHITQYSAYHIDFLTPQLTLSQTHTHTLPPSLTLQHLASISRMWQPSWLLWLPLSPRILTLHLWPASPWHTNIPYPTHDPLNQAYPHVSSPGTMLSLPPRATERTTLMQILHPGNGSSGHFSKKGYHLLP